MKKIFRIFRDIVTVRSLRKAIIRRVKEYKTDKKFISLPKWDGNVRPHTVLICEPHFGHGECLAGWTKYWNELGYNVDVITRYTNYIEKPFCNYPTPPRFFAGSLRMLKRWLHNDRTCEYDYIFISTTVLWDDGFYNKHFLDFLGFIPKCKNGCMFIDHAPNAFFDKYNEKTLVTQKRIFTLSNLSYIAQLNPMYFGEFDSVQKNSIPTFVAIGRSNARNYDNVIDVVRALASQGKKFVIKFIGSGSINIPEDLKEYMICLGRLDYPAMYKELSHSDFIIAGLDPHIENQKQYLQGCTTGNLQLSFGFSKPMIINKLFGRHYELDGASIMYDEDDLLHAMETAVTMEGDEYKKITVQLKELANETYKRSLNNLENAISYTQRQIFFKKPSKEKYKLKKFFISLIPIKSVRHKLKDKIFIKYNLQNIKYELPSLANKETIFVVGDSHTDIFNHNTYSSKRQIYKDCKLNNMLSVNTFNAPNFVTYHIGAALAYTTNATKSSFNSLNKTEFLIKQGLLPYGSKILCCFGEIDCRVHVKKQAEQSKISISNVIDNILHNYEEYLLYLRDMGYRVIAYGPVSSQKDSVKIDSAFPRYGSELERNKITEQFNKKLYEFCGKNRIAYFSVYEFLINSDGSTKGEYFCDGVHLNLKALEFIMQGCSSIDNLFRNNNEVKTD
jgi:hypothetical protein